MRISSRDPNGESGRSDHDHSPSSRWWPRRSHWSRRRRRDRTRARRRRHENRHLPPERDVRSARLTRSRWDRDVLLHRRRGAPTARTRGGAFRRRTETRAHASRDDADAGTESLLGNEIDSRHWHALSATRAATAFRVEFETGVVAASLRCRVAGKAVRLAGGVVLETVAAGTESDHGFSRDRFFCGRPKFLRRGRRGLCGEPDGGRSRRGPCGQTARADSESGRCRFLFAQR